MIRWAAGAAVASIVSGCFGPTFGSGELLCDDGECPPGLECDRGICVASPTGTFCGDGLINGPELCDDGNNSDGDGCAADCASANCLVPVTHETVGAILADGACTTAFIASGTYTETISITGDRTLVGVGATKPVIDGAGQGTVVTTAGGTIEIESLVIRGGVAANGGGIANTANLTLRSVEVRDNEAVGAQQEPLLASVEIRGGGIHHASGSLLIEDSVVENNQIRATAFGTMTNVLLGGGIAADGPLTLQGTTVVRGNLAVSEPPVQTITIVAGGGVFVGQTTFLMAAGASLENNEARFRDDVDGFIGVGIGGGMYLSGSAWTCIECSVIGNRAVSETNANGSVSGSQGGGIMLVSGSASLDRATVTDNVAISGIGNVGAQGGAMFLSSGNTTLDIVDSVISNNIADCSAATAGLSSARGGGLRITSQIDLSMDNSRVEGNQVLGSLGFAAGGGIDIDVGNDAVVDADIVGTTIASNSVVGMGVAQGGGLYLNVRGTGSSTPRLDGVTVSGNSVSGSMGSGGGLYALSSGTHRVDVINSTVSGNTATHNGAGLFVDASNADALDVFVSFATVAFNDAGAAGQGGGLYLGAIDPSNTVRFSRNIFDKNSAGSGPDCLTVGGAELYGDFNLINSNSCTLAATAVGNLIAVAVALAPLADNGGSTFTHALGSGGSATDAGGPGPCRAANLGVESQDQRGEPRPAGAACDIGAFELQ